MQSAPREWASRRADKIAYAGSAAATGPGCDAEWACVGVAHGWTTQLDNTGGRSCPKCPVTILGQQAYARRVCVQKK